MYQSLDQMIAPDGNLCLSCLKQHDPTPPTETLASAVPMTELNRSKRLPQSSYTTHLRPMRK